MKAPSKVSPNAHPALKASAVAAPPAWRSITPPGRGIRAQVHTNEAAQGHTHRAKRMPALAWLSAGGFEQPQHVERTCPGGRLSPVTFRLTELDLAGGTGMRGLAEFVLRHRKLVMMFWGLVLIAGIALAGRTTSRLTVDFSLPGQPGSETAHKIAQAFGNGGNTNPFVVTVTMPKGQTISGHEADVARSFAAIGAAVPSVRVVDEDNTGDHAFRTANDQTAYALVFWRFNPSPTQTILTDPIHAAAQAAAPAGATIGVTGEDALAVGDSGAAVPEYWVRP